jgi:hypothetical protein
VIARLAKSNLAHMAGAFLAMGGWALFANRTHGLAAALPAAVLQGALSAGITLTLKTVVERLAPRFAGMAALFAPPLIAAGLSAALLTTLHRLAGTPEVLATVALPLTVAASYAAIYNTSLWAARRR